MEAQSLGCWWVSGERGKWMGLFSNPEASKSPRPFAEISQVSSPTTLRVVFAKNRSKENHIVCTCSKDRLDFPAQVQSCRVSAQQFLLIARTWRIAGWAWKWPTRRRQRIFIVLVSWVEKSLYYFVFLEKEQPAREVFFAGLIFSARRCFFCCFVKTSLLGFWNLTMDYRLRLPSLTRNMTCYSFHYQPKPKHNEDKVTPHFLLVSRAFVAMRGLWKIIEIFHVFEQIFSVLYSCLI